MSRGFAFEQLVDLFGQTHSGLQRRAARSVDLALVARNWLFGWYIVEYEQNGTDRAEYGSQLLANLSERLQRMGIKGSSQTRLKLYRAFYHQYKRIGPTASDQLAALPSLRGESRDSTDSVGRIGSRRQGWQAMNATATNSTAAQPVPPGYKRTEVGVIPVDWEVKPAGDLCRVNQGLQISISNRLKKPSPTSRKYITIQYLNEGKEVEYIDDYTPSICCNENDVLMTRTGNTGIVVTGVEGVFHNNFFKINYDKKLLEKGYLVNYLSQERLQRLILVKAGTSTIPDLNHGDFYSIPITLPSPPEQRAIAAALSDVDGLIRALDKLIAKKRAIKQAAMQQLLTGKTRLPGLRGEWSNVRLRDLLSYERPDRHIVRDTEYSERGDIPVLTANKSFILGYTIEDFGICRDLPAIVFDDFTTDRKYVNFPFKVKSSAIKLLRPKHDRVDLRFVFDRMQLIHFPLGDHKRYYISEYQNVTLAAPDYEEQRAIAAVLSDMDAEIAALERRRDKTKQIKQGMMQSLLTGRVRLVKPEAAA